MRESGGIAGRLRVGALSRRKPLRLDIAPDAAARAALAAEFGLLDLPALRLRGELAPEGREDWRLEAQLDATVVQPCVVSLAPVTTTISEPVLRRYVADLPPPAGDEIEMPEDDSIEPLPPVIDLGAVMAEALALALPAYPRAGDADAAEGPAEPGGAAGEGRTRPFSGLDDLLKSAGKAPRKPG